ncbi:MAG: VWA domain-containing protein [Acidobacteriota bacterium]|nr:VWA domain-containing protein [Acidobacteriota bacterium]
MKQWIPIALCWVALVPPILRAQSATADATPTISTRSTLVLVPALVRDKAGQLVYTLKAGDFSLTDDGVPQPVHLEEDTGGEPLALVVLIEAGGDGVRELGKYGALAGMLESVVGAVRHRVAVVAFDAHPELEEDFTEDVGAAAEIIQQVADAEAGDKGGAILDALAYSIDLLRKQPPEYRRAVLMLTETRDRGSGVSLETALRAVSDTNTSVYAIGFSSAKSDVAHEASKLSSAQPGPAGGCMARDHTDDPTTSDNPFIQAWDCLSQLAPPLRLVKMAAFATEGLRRNVPETVARLTGGEYFKLGNTKSFERTLQTISNHIPNRYVLSFQPQTPHPGLHLITLELKEYPQLKVTARTSYWAAP